jgi:hypothetical protein
MTMKRQCRTVCSAILAPMGVCPWWDAARKQ